MASNVITIPSEHSPLGRLSVRGRKFEISLTRVPAVLSVASTNDAALMASVRVEPLTARIAIESGRAYACGSRRQSETAQERILSLGGNSHTLF